MLSPPEGVREEELVGMAEDQYGARDLGTHRLEFVPLGQDSWCYRLGDLWISVRRDLRGHVPAAYEAARRLRLSGLDFVLAPLAGDDGRVVHPVDGFPVVVFPYLDVEPVTADTATPEDRSRIAEMLSRVHESSVSVDLPTEDYTLSFEDDLDRALAAVEAPPPDTGPYGERFHSLVRSHRARIVELRSEYEGLAAWCAAQDRSPVLTHGEPIPSNVLRHDGELLLADWGGAMLGPPERDWSQVLRTLEATVSCRPRFRRLYDLWWILSEIAEYATVFLQGHDGDPDDGAMWERLLRYLPEEA